jgi:acyl-CoA thioester hydrolase
MEKLPSSLHQIRYQDCDPLSHLNNARYIDYFMNAREDHLMDHYGLDIYERLRKDQKSWVVAKSEIVYRAPAMLMEKVLIRSQVNSYSIKHIVVEMAMYDENGKVLKALMRTVFVHFDARSGKAIEHDETIMDLLKKVQVDRVVNSMEERVAQLEGRMEMA